MKVKITLTVPALSAPQGDTNSGPRRRRRRRRIRRRRRRGTNT
ncbi:MAG TPA: hypothetical protein VG144_00060 [Gaiellaceae bacterium]|nr:hypothetical protein [Gaiellaceae bacterium]